MYPVTFKAFVVLNEDSKRDIEGVYYSSEFHNYLYEVQLVTAQFFYGGTRESDQRKGRQ